MLLESRLTKTRVLKWVDLEMEDVPGKVKHTKNLIHTHTLTLKTSPTCSVIVHLD